MRERTHEIKIRLNGKELAHLNEMVGRSIYNRETFLRLLIDGCTMQECPKEYNEFRVTLIRLASDLKLFKFNSALTPPKGSQANPAAIYFVGSVFVLAMPLPVKKR